MGPIEPLPSPRFLDAPGKNGEYAVLRFTAPADGTYKVSGQFFARITTTPARRRMCGFYKTTTRPAFRGKVDCYGGKKSASFTSKIFQLKKRNTLDFQVGYGENKNYFYDSTGLVAIIEKEK